MTLPPSGRRILGSLLPPSDRDAHDDGAAAYEEMYGDASKVVDEAIRAAKLLPTDRADYMQRMATDPSGTRRLIAMLTASAAPRAIAASTRDDSDDYAEYAALYGTAGHPVAAAVSTYRPDPYALNPLADELRELQPALYRAAARSGPPPTLFAVSDIPPFTASGIDPVLLMSLPWQARHPAAETRDRRVAQQIFEDYAGNPDMAGWQYNQHRSNTDYILRVRDWAMGKGDYAPADVPSRLLGRPSPTISAGAGEMHAEYAALFGNGTQVTASAEDDAPYRALYGDQAVSRDPKAGAA